jgi:hypothetical protein
MLNMTTERRYRRMPNPTSQTIRAIARDSTPSETARKVLLTATATFVLLIATAHHLVQAAA